MVGCSLCNLCSKSLNLAANLILPSGVEPYGESGGRKESRGESCWTMEVSQSMRVPSGGGQYWGRKGVILYCGGLK